MEKLDVGALVKTTYGRDSGDMFIVLEVLNKFAIIADGKKRTKNHAKKKNIKHLYLLKKDTLLKEKISSGNFEDALLITAIKSYKSMQKNQTGGN